MNERDWRPGNPVFDDLADEARARYAESKKFRDIPIPVNPKVIKDIPPDPDTIIDVLRLIDSEIKKRSYYITPDGYTVFAMIQNSYISFSSTSILRDIPETELFDFILESYKKLLPPS